MAAAILGLSGLYHDSAASLVLNGRIVAAAQEERFTRIKHDPSLPHRAVDYCLREGGLSASDLDYVIFYEKPLLKFDRLLETYLAYAPKGLVSFNKAMPPWLKEKLHIPGQIRKLLGNRYRKSVLFCGHHESHAASAFYPSPFEEAAVLTIDGVGEWDTTTLWKGEGNRLEPLRQIHFPHSLGLLYSAFTYFSGFRVNSGEYKLMGLAPYGKPIYRDLILKELIDLRSDGSFRLNMDYFGYGSGLTMTNKRFERLFKGPPREPESPLTQREMDMASSVQSVTEEAVLHLAKAAKDITGSENLALAGGVALNCVANGEVLRKKIFKNLWIQPASGDAGGALGAALLVHHSLLKQTRTVRRPDSMENSLLGPSFKNDEISTFLEKEKIVFERFPEAELLRRVVSYLSDEKVVGWFHGRMEFGPRALGGRSILGDPRSPRMQSRMNMKIKYRESFRPFAPSVMEEAANSVFELDGPSPYMLLVADLRDKFPTSGEADIRARIHEVRSPLPAITHVDYSARVQTVNEGNGRYYRLLKAWEAATGCPVLINTSFNIRGEPIVCSPEDALRCFLNTEMDVLVLEDCVIEKTDAMRRPAEDLAAYQRQFNLD